MRKIDIYNHAMPKPFLDRLREAAPGSSAHFDRIAAVTVVHDIEARVRMIDRWPGYQQVLSLANPPIESLVGPGDSPALARAGNDALRDICAQRPDKFPAWVAALPLNNIPESLAELDRAIAIGACGVQIYSNIAGRPLDDPALFPVLERVVNHHRVPIWLHPSRGADSPDYLGESASKYDVWRILGWPYETSVAMARLVFSGLLDRLPEMKIVTHHLGAMIPFFEGRVRTMWDHLDARAPGSAGPRRRPVEYFRMFHGDTAVCGSRAALACGLDFFGPRQVLFASDCPFDPEGGTMFIRETIAAIDRLGLSDEDRRAIYHGNALRLLGRAEPGA